MSYRRYLPAVKSDFAIIDSNFPQREPLAFRNAEINEYFRRFQNVTAFSMYPMAPDADAWFTHSYGLSEQDFNDNFSGYLKHYPQNASRIRYLNPERRYSIKLAYSFFLGETYVLLPFFERHKIPFVFMLYPGGCFELNDPKSDAMLAKIFRSPFFRGVIVSQPFTQEYLVANKLCPPDQISLVYGCLTQFTRDELLPKRRFGRDKDQFDICFVGAKYTPGGYDKGYDVFIDAAKHLARVRPDINFHVVGGFDPSDFNVSELGERIKFYGYRRPDFLKDFYSGMDILLSPNRAHGITKGNFDGFPIGFDASFCGAALFVADPLNINRYYEPGRELEIINHDPRAIADLVLEYFDAPDRLYELSHRGQTKTQTLFDTGHQIEGRLKVFRRHVELKP